jgi:rsbT co-antagonist protein RsbR
MKMAIRSFSGFNNSALQWFYFRVSRAGMVREDAAMRHVLTRLLTVNSSDEDIRRRGRMLVSITLAMIALALLAFFLILLSLSSPDLLVVVGIGLIGLAVVLALARRGTVTAAGVLLVAMLLLATLVSVDFTGQATEGEAAYFLILPLLVAGLTLRPVYAWVVLALALAGLGVSLALNPQAIENPPIQMLLLNIVLLLVFTTLLGYFGSRATANALAQARGARVAAEAAAERQEQANTDLEMRVQERTIALQRALTEVETRATEQARLLEENQQQREAIRDLSVPVLPVSAATLVMPLVGTLDTTRLALAQQQALNALEHSHARYLMLDITGVPLVDSQVAQGLIVVVQAARLLGAEVVLVGVRPEVAQAIVGLGIELPGIRTFRDLQSAIVGVVEGNVQ